MSDSSLNLLFVRQQAGVAVTGSTYLSASGWHDCLQQAHHSFALIHSFVRDSKRTALQASFIRATASGRRNASSDTSSLLVRQQAVAGQASSDTPSLLVRQQAVAGQASSDTTSLLVRQQAVAEMQAATLHLYSCDSKRSPDKQAATLHLYSCDSKRSPDKQAAHESPAAPVTSWRAARATRSTMSPSRARSPRTRRTAPTHTATRA